MKILAIDDNRDNLAVLKAFVEQKLPGDRLLAVNGGLRGLELARIEDPDVILVNVDMPGMDGFELCRGVKADPGLHLIPVLFLTSVRGEPGMHVKAVEAGADGFLAKPFDESELVVQIRAMAKVKAAALLQRDSNEQLAALVAERTRELQQSQATALNLLESLREENEARKRSEEALRKITSRQEAILDAIPDIIMEVDAGKVYRWANQAGLDFFGSDVIGREAADYFVGEQKTYADVQPLFNGHEATVNVESWQLRKDGARRLLAWRCRVLRDAQGAVTGALSTAHDITERRVAEEERSRQLEELKRWHAVTLGREGRVAELKREVNALATRLGQPPPYAETDRSARNPAT